MKVSRSAVINSILILVAVLGVMFSALQYFSNPRPSLQATIRGYPHYHLIDWESTDLLERQTIRGKSVFGEQSDDVDRVSGVFHILLDNEGSETARNISIVVDYAIGMMISQRNESKIIYGDKVILGDMKPNEDATIISWTTTPATLYRFGRPRVTITHDNGIVELDQRYEIEGVLRFVHRNHLHIFFVPILGGCIFIISLLMIVGRSRRKEAQNANAAVENDDQNDT